MFLCEHISEHSTTHSGTVEQKYYVIVSN